MLKLYALVFVGGGLGSAVRFGVARLVVALFAPTLPFATLGVNILGSFLIGLFWGMPFLQGKNSWMPFLTVGFCGGFTTFSAFSWESFKLLRQGEAHWFFVYAFASVLCCLAATWGGYALGKTMSA